MVPVERFALERHRAEADKDHECDHFLDHLQLDQAERSAVVPETDPVGGDLEAIFEKGEEPAEQHDVYQRQMIEPAELLPHLQMPVPGTGHEDIGHDQ